MNILKTIIVLLAVTASGCSSEREEQVSSEQPRPEGARIKEAGKSGEHLTAYEKMMRENGIKPNQTFEESRKTGGLE